VAAPLPAQEPEPFDFTVPFFAGMLVPPGPGMLYALVTRGIAGTSMRAFGADLGPWERLAVVAYIAGFASDSTVGGRQAWADSLRRRRQRPP